MTQPNQECDPDDEFPSAVTWKSVKTYGLRIRRWTTRTVIGILGVSAAVAACAIAVRFGWLLIREAWSLL